MNDAADKIERLLLKEYVKRVLIKYFFEKGYDNYGVSPYPPVLLDIVEKIPMFSDCIEITYNVDDIDMSNNSVKLAWNIFVLGTNRIDLGSTVHQNMTDVDNAALVEFNGPHTIEEIIEYIVDTLGMSEKIKDCYLKRNFVDNKFVPTRLHNMRPETSPKPDFKRRV